jgi:hypothetical protein
MLPLSASGNNQLLADSKLVSWVPGAGGAQMANRSLSVARGGTKTHFLFSFCVSKFFHCPKTTKTLRSNPSISPLLQRLQGTVRRLTKHLLARRCDCLVFSVNT